MKTTQVQMQDILPPLDNVDVLPPLEMEEEEPSIKEQVGKTILQTPRKGYENVLSVAEGVTGQMTGAAGAVGGAAVATRNYLTTLFETGNPEKAYESATKGAKEVAGITGAWKPSTELGQRGLKTIGQVIEGVVKPIAETAGKEAVNQAKSWGVPKEYIPAIKSAAETGTEFAVVGEAFKGGMKGGGLVKNQLRSILGAKKVATPTEAEFQAAPSGRPFYEAKGFEGGFEEGMAKPKYEGKSAEAVQPEAKPEAKPIEEPTGRKWYEAGEEAKTTKTEVPPPEGFVIEEPKGEIKDVSKIDTIAEKPTDFLS